MLNVLVIRSSLLILTSGVYDAACALNDIPSKVDVPVAEQADVSEFFAKGAASESPRSRERGDSMEARGVYDTHAQERARATLPEELGFKVAVPDEGAGPNAPAFAQVTFASEAGRSPSSAGNDQSVSSSHDKLSVVVVTAQKQEELLKDVPVPVTVLSAESLSNTSELRLEDYFDSVPGLNLQPGYAQSSQIQMRGLSSGAAVANPSVGTVIDDVPFGSSLLWGGGYGVPDIDPGDLARIEVLRGPQGTLYGASSLGGLLKFVTIDPSTNGSSGRLQVGSNTIKGGRHVGHSVRGSMNIPVGEAFALRASGFNYVQPGFIDNVNTGKKDVNEITGRGAHLAALWQASDAVTVKVGAFVQRREPRGSWRTLGSLGDLKQDQAVDVGKYQKDVKLYSATLTAKLGRAELTSLTSYNHFMNAGIDDSGSRDIQYTIDSRASKYSQELRVAMPLSGRIDWLIGAFYADEQFAGVEGLPFVDPVTGARTGMSVLDSLTSAGDHREFAAFTNFTVKLTDRLDIQLGGRQAHYNGEFQQVWIGPLDTAGGIIPAVFGSPFYPPHVNYSDDAFTYLVTPRFKLSQDWMVYGRLASGYRTGGPNSSLGNDVLPTMRPDNTKNYELGMKGEFLDQRISVDASVYYIEWNDIQLFTSYLLPNDIAASIYINGKGAKSQGMEVSFELRPWRGLKTALWSVWNTAELTDDMPPNVLTAGRAGDRLPQGPRFSGHLSLEQEFYLARGTSVFLGGSVSYVGSRMSEFLSRSLEESGLARVALPAYTKIDLNAGVRLDSWDVGLYLNNVADKRAGTGFDPITKNGQPIQPRTIGLTLSKRF